MRPAVVEKRYPAPRTRLHQGVAGVRLQGLAQAPDVHVYGAFFDVHAASPDVVEQLAARVHAFGVSHEKVQQSILGRSDRHGFRAGVNAMRRAVDLQATHLDDAVGVGAVGATHHCIDAGDQFARRKRFHHIVVDAGFQAADAIGFLRHGPSA